MNKRLLIILVLVSAMLLAACKPKGTAGDANSAQNLQPSIPGFTTTNLDTAVDAISLSAGTSALATGNIALSAAIERANSLLQCLQDTGAVSGLGYLQQDPGVVPQMGASLVVNKTRVQQNLFACMGTQVFAQTDLAFEVCAQDGEFTSGGDNFWYAYVGVGTDMCSGFRAHYNANNPQLTSITVLGQYP